MTDDTQPKVGDACTMPDGAAGTLQDDGTNTGTLTCVVTPPVQSDPPPAQPSDSVMNNGEQIAAPKVGDTCTCPDGRVGTIQAGSEEGTVICLPNGN